MVDEAQRAEAERDEVSRHFANDQFYQALAARPRRRALAHVLTAERATVEELVDVLCGWEAAENRAVDSARAAQIRVELAHQHLPLLAEADLVSYDRDTGEVGVEAHDPAVERLVRRSIEAE